MLRISLYWLLILTACMGKKQFDNNNVLLLWSVSIFYIIYVYIYHAYFLFFVRQQNNLSLIMTYCQLKENTWKNIKNPFHRIIIIISDKSLYCFNNIIDIIEITNILNKFLVS